jgi:non-specific serine/threonine protein kinase
VRRDWRRASALFEGALAVYRDLGDKRGLAWTLNNLGLIAYDQGEYERAVALHEESLAIHRALGAEDGAGISLYDLGNAVHAVGDTRRARTVYDEALSLLRDAGDKALMAFGIEGLARVALSEGQPERTVRLCGAADALRTAIEAPLPPPDRPLYARTLAEGHRLLGEEEFAQAWRQGRAMTLEQAIAYALEVGDYA